MVFLQCCMNGTLHALAFAPTKLAHPAEQRALLYQQPHAIAHPVVPVILHCHWLLAGDFQFIEGFWGWELQWELMTFRPILLQLPLPCADGRDDGPVVRVVISLWPSEPNVPKLPGISSTCKNVIWLRVMRPPFPLVPPGPLFPGRCLCG